MMMKVSTILVSLMIILSSIVDDVYAFKIVNVIAFGAVGDGETDDTEAIRKTIVLHSKPDTIIWFPPNHIFLSQPLNLTSYTTLQIDGILKSINIESKWPQILPLTSYNTSEDYYHYLQYQAFLYATDSKYITIFGSGEIDGNGNWWWDTFKNNKQLLHAGRPNIIQFVHCKFIELTHITLRDSPFWCIHPVYCEYITIRHITIRARTYAPNSDGIDPDSSKHVLIEHNDIGCGDDHIAIKAGRCGSKPNDPSTKIQCINDDRFRNGLFQTTNITIRHNIFRNGMGIAIGSESSGGISNINIYNNVIGVCTPGGECSKCCGWGPALHIKTTLSRGGTIENITFSDNIIYNTSGFILVESNYQDKENVLPSGYDPVSVKNITFLRNQALGTGIGASFHCSKQDACHNIQVINNSIAIPSTQNVNPWHCSYIDSFTVSGNYPDGLQECMEQSMNSSSSSRTISQQ